MGRERGDGEVRGWGMLVGGEGMVRLGGGAYWVGREGDEVRGWGMLDRERREMRLGDGACW